MLVMIVCDVTWDELGESTSFSWIYVSISLYLSSWQYLNNDIFIHPFGCLSINVGQSEYIMYQSVYLSSCQRLSVNL